MMGKLLKFNPSMLMLGKNEICHFMDKAALVVKQKEKTYHSQKNGGSYKITKNYTIHSSHSNMKPFEQEWYEFKEGIVFVINQRIIFVESEYGFEKS